jgi:hypothetical protein
MATFPFTKTLFWDVNLEKIDVISSKKFIIERVLVRGGMKDVKKIFSLYSRAELIQAIKESRDLDRITHNFCSNYFDIPKTAMHAPSQYH